MESIKQADLLPVYEQKMARHEALREAYRACADVTPDEKRQVEIQESQIAALGMGRLQAAHRILWAFDRVQVMTRHKDPQNPESHQDVPQDYAAAVDHALFFSRDVWLREISQAKKSDVD
ncbi:MAG: hypothetical protein B7X46_13055 [Thiomonas sp. 15-66-11]|jgi:hypothetical protein|nr:MAG: hypothetical protein B7X46_13055 [Thiomonas sp. 15-66-11]